MWFHVGLEEGKQKSSQVLFELKMEVVIGITVTVYWGYIGIMEKKMEITI